MINDVSIVFCTYFKRIEEFIYESEVYSEYVIFCLKSGSFYYSIDSDKEQILNAGEFVICPPGKRFYRKIKKSVELCMIKFMPTETPDFISKSIAVSDITRLNANLKKLENYIHCTDIEKYPQAYHYCRDILYLAADSYTDNSALSEFHKIIIESFDEEINVELLAKKSGYSTVHFINLFKKNYGITPKKYATLIRLQKAKELLVNTDKTSKEISYLCGFRDELYFIRHFKKYNAVTPVEYRRQMKAGKL